jgi:ABC-type iron transport system FetAB permease component
MERLTVQQRWVVAVLALVVAVISLGYFIYWVAIVANHPWFKHSLLFAVLAIAGLAVAAYAWPRTPRTE